MGNFQFYPKAACLFFVHVKWMFCKVVFVDWTVLAFVTLTINEAVTFIKFPFYNSTIILHNLELYSCINHKLVQHWYLVIFQIALTVRCIKVGLHSCAIHTLLPTLRVLLTVTCLFYICYNISCEVFIIIYNPTLVILS